MHSAAVGRNQTKAKVAWVPRHVGFRLDQPTGRGTANNAENANGALARPGPDFRQCRTNLHLRVLRYLRFPLPCVGAIACVR